MGEAGLKLVVTDLMIAGVALRASAAATDKRNGYAITFFPIGNILADRLNSSSQFMAWNMGKPDVGVVAHPTLPIASADAGCHHLDNNTVRFRGGIRNAYNSRRLQEGLIKYCFHLGLPLLIQPGAERKLYDAESDTSPNPGGLFDASLAAVIKPQYYNSLHILSIS